MLTPTDIQNREFKRSFRGYNEDQIDEFLDQVTADYDKLYRENARLKEDLARMQKDNDQYHQLEQNLQDTLLVAQKTAQEVTANAKQNASDIRESTLRECQAMKNRAELETRQQIATAAEKVRGIVVEYDRLVREKNKFLSKIRILLESELAVLNDTIDGLPHPELEEKVPPVGSFEESSAAAVPSFAEKPAEAEGESPAKEETEGGAYENEDTVRFDKPPLAEGGEA